MTTDLAKNDHSGAAIMERVLVAGDLSRLTAQERTTYLLKTCETLGLNPLTKPFDYFNLNGKLVLYAKKDCTDQLRTIHGVSLGKPEMTFVDGLCIVTVDAKAKNGREDSDVGAVPIEGLKGIDRANA